MEIKKYIIKAIKNWKDPIWWRNAFLWGIIFPIMFRNNDGSYIFDEPWDNLIILDACRYDMFKEEFIKRRMKGRLEYKISRGTDTVSFLIENFKDKKYNDIVYITANPFVNRLLKDKFYKIISVWKYGWDEKNQTVLPETMYKYTLKALIQYPTKRLIIHFIQPHYPYIGYSFTDGSFEELRNATLYNINPEIERKYRDNITCIYSMDIYAMIDKNLQFVLYRKNLKLALHYVEKLINTLPGKTVVTADHGEALGEKLHPLLPIRVYGHIAGVRIPVLKKVPWLIIEPEEKEFSLKNIKKEIARTKGVFTKYEDKKLKKAIKSLKLKGKI